MLYSSFVIFLPCSTFITSLTLFLICHPFSFVLSFSPFISSLSPICLHVFYLDHLPYLVLQLSSRALFITSFTLFYLLPCSSFITYLSIYLSPLTLFCLCYLPFFVLPLLPFFLCLAFIRAYPPTHTLRSPIPLSSLEHFSPRIYVFLVFFYILYM